MNCTVSNPRFHQSWMNSIHSYWLHFHGIFCFSFKAEQIHDAWSNRPWWGFPTMHQVTPLLRNVWCWKSSRGQRSGLVWLFVNFSILLFYVICTLCLKMYKFSFFLKKWISMRNWQYEMIWYEEIFAKQRRYQKLQFIWKSKCNCLRN